MTRTVSRRVRRSRARQMSGPATLAGLASVVLLAGAVLASSPALLYGALAIGSVGILATLAVATRK